nr:hypothetical protein [Caldanaerovirga acetigignens]
MKLFRYRPSKPTGVYTLTLKLLKAFRIFTEAIEVIGRSATNRALIDIYTKQVNTSNRRNGLTLCFSFSEDFPVIFFLDDRQRVL